jgi:AAA+ superfamily predicted ATPase
MLKKQTSANKALECVESLYNKIIDNGYNSICSGITQWKYLEKRFSLERIQLLVFIPILSNKLLGKRSLDFEDLVKLLRFSIAKIDVLHYTLQQLILRGLVAKAYYDEERFTYTIRRAVIKKILVGESIDLLSAREKSMIGFFECLFSPMEAYDAEEISQDILSEYVNLTFEDPYWKDLDEVTAIREMQLSSEQRILLCLVYFICINANNDVINLDELMVKLGYTSNQRRQITDDIFAAEHPFIKDELLQFKIAGGGFKSIHAMRLGKKSLELLGKKKQKIFAAEKGTVIKPVDIQEKKMLYNEKENETIQQIIQNLSDKQFHALMKRYVKNGMPDNLIVCLHGKPGTGKTETVYQIARRTNRSIYRVDIEQIKDMYVGESEKNLRKMFAEYKDLKEISSACPILLINECDSLIRKKVRENSSTDQMSNNMINLLLDEIERFSGILFCTTNSTSQFEEPFFRRLLFLLELHAPGPDIVAKLIKQKFAEYDITSDLSNKIAHTYSLTGAQIDNIQRKLIATTSFENDTQSFEEIILNLAKEEKHKNENSGPVIVTGFLGSH